MVDVVMDRMVAGVVESDGVVCGGLVWGVCCEGVGWGGVGGV